MTQPTAGFLSPLTVTLLDDIANEGSGNWRVEAPLIYWSQVAGRLITVPPGFETDFASVPRLPFVFMIHGNKAHRPATLHDFCYHTKLIPRELCDAVFREAIIAIGLTADEAEEFYLGVHLGGESHYGT